ncbi:MAG: hypothetical protein F4186_08135 [Boseongicola sp. SB0676_bin_33]|nr:hypothetical protein [Boseongicola sp. SB0676_bin_33]MYK30972.1 hypothetical protein [Boseongicola sp. SB0670_bin_30]
MAEEPQQDPWRARSALDSPIPTSTESAMAITFIHPEFEGRLNGQAVRGPLLIARHVDAEFRMESEEAS